MPYCMPVSAGCPCRLPVALRDCVSLQLMRCFVCAALLVNQHADVFQECPAAHQGSAGCPVCCVPAQAVEGANSDAGSADEPQPLVRENNLYVKHFEPSLDSAGLRAMFEVRREGFPLLCCTHFEPSDLAGLRARSKLRATEHALALACTRKNAQQAMREPRVCAAEAQ